jgi:hypothetical protein
LSSVSRRLADRLAGLTNDELAAKYAAAWAQYEAGNHDIASLMGVIYDEIDRRQRAHRWTEEDWVRYRDLRLGLPPIGFW